MERLRGAAVIVTGAARGIGAAYAKALAAEGANVVIADILDTSSVVTEITGIGGNAIGISCDVTDNASVEGLVARVVAEYGKIDALINNAAIFAEISHKRFEDIPDSEWGRVMQVNVEGVWRVSKAVVPHMRAAKYGKIVNITRIKEKEYYKEEIINSFIRICIFMFHSKGCHISIKVA